MTRSASFLILAFGWQLAVAQSLNPVEPVMDVVSERARIQMEREAGESRFSLQESACYARFAVTDCLHEVRLSRRLMMDDLRRQTMMLNDMERREKSLSKLELSKRKSDARKTD